MANNNDKKVLKSSIEREQNDCSAECEKIKGSKNLNVPDKRVQNDACISSAEREEQVTEAQPKGNVPALRFPEFSGEWENCLISDFGVIITGNTPPTKDADNYKEGIKLWASPIDLGKSKWIYDTQTKLSVAGFDKTRKLPEGAILVTCIGSTIGKMGMATCEMATNQQINSIVTNSDNDKDFVYYAIESNFQKYLASVAVQAVPIISKSSFERLPNRRTTLAEQTKIGKFLSLIDKRIETQNKIIEDLKKLKSALADKLYSSTKGETYSFRQLFDVVNERNKKLTYSNVLSASQELGMIERSDINIDIKFEQDSISKYKIVRRGDYVVHLRSFQGGFAFSDRTGICSPAYTILRPNDMVVYGYLSLFFTSKPFIKSLKLVTYGIRDGRSINVEEWLDMTVTLPTRQEQSHIISIINTIDDKLNNENQIHTCLLQQRAFLLKVMFI